MPLQQFYHSPKKRQANKIKKRGICCGYLSLCLKLWKVQENR
jgi:hypothetical protein